MNDPRRYARRRAPRVSRPGSPLPSTARGFAIALCALLLLAGGRSWAQAETPADDRTPLAEVYGETIYVEDVEGAVAFRIFKHELDIYSLLKSEAEQRIEKKLLAREAAERGISVEALLAAVDGETVTVEESEIDRYLAEHPAPAGRDSAQARRRVRHYLQERARLERRVAFMDALHEKAGTRILLAAPLPPRTEVETDGAPRRGPESASVEIVHFASFGSRNAARSARKIDRLREAYPGRIRQVHLNLLNDRDERGLAAARIAFAAADSNRFWEVHDRFFSQAAERATIEELEELAIEIGVPEKLVRAAKNDLGRLRAVKRDIDTAQAAGVPREPGLFINGRFASGLLPYDEIDKIVAEEFAREETR